MDLIENDGKNDFQVLNDRENGEKLEGKNQTSTYFHPPPVHRSKTVLNLRQFLRPYSSVTGMSEIYRVGVWS